MRRSGRIVRQVLEAAKEAVAPGCSTMDLERVAERKIRGLRREAGIQGLLRLSLRAVRLGE